MILKITKTRELLSWAQMIALTTWVNSPDNAVTLDDLPKGGTNYALQPSGMPKKDHGWQVVGILKSLPENGGKRFGVELEVPRYATAWELDRVGDTTRVELPISPRRFLEAIFKAIEAAEE